MNKFLFKITHSNFKHYNVYEQTSVCFPISNSRTIKRSMWNVIRGDYSKDYLLRSMKNYPNNYSQLTLRNYTDEYKAIWYRENAVQPNGKPITPHEATHANILDIKNKDSTKYEGSFVPLKDANSKLITDIKGCSAPNPNKDRQFVVPLSKVRHMIDESIYTKEDYYSKYCNTHNEQFPGVTHLYTTDLLQFGNFYHKSVSNTSILNAIVNA